MPSTEDSILRIGRLEDKIHLYEPLLTGLHGLVSVPEEIDRIYDELRILQNSRIEVGGKLSALFKDQAKSYNAIVDELEKSAKVQDKKIRDCPIKTVDIRLNDVEKEMGSVDVLGNRLEVAEKTIDSFKLKGWDLLLRIIPWIIAAGAATYAMCSRGA